MIRQSPDGSEAAQAHSLLKCRLAVRKRHCRISRAERIDAFCNPNFLLSSHLPYVLDRLESKQYVSCRLRAECAAHPTTTVRYLLLDSASTNARHAVSQAHHHTSSRTWNQATCRWMGMDNVCRDDIISREIEIHPARPSKPLPCLVLAHALLPCFVQR